MKLETKYHGVIEVDQKKMIHFTNGLPGFLDETDFIILDLPDNTVFQILQSAKTSNLAFIITSPYLFYEEYSLKLTDDLLEALSIKSEQEVVVYTIVTLIDPFAESTINLRAPIVINSEVMKGKQYILNDVDYSSKAPITPEQREAK